MYSNFFKKQPLYNYATFATKLNLYKGLDNIGKVKIASPSFFDRIDSLEKRLINFILDHSTIKKLGRINYEHKQFFLNHPRFDACFHELKKLSCDFNDDPDFLNKLANSCKNIQILQ